MAGPIAADNYLFGSLTEAVLADVSKTFISRECRSFTGSHLQLLRSDSIAAATTVPATPDVCVSLALRGIATGRFDFGDGWREFQHWPGSMLMQPHGTECDFVIDRPRTVLSLAFPFRRAVMLVEESGGQMPSSGFGPLYGCSTADGVIRDRFMEQLLRRLWEEAANDAPLGQLFANSALGSLVAALLRRAETRSANMSSRSRRRVAALPPWRVKRLEAAVQERLTEDLALADLAEMAGLSRFHFARAFKAATGRSPYFWLIERRVAQARRLLAEDTLPLAEVALACGFSSQSRFTAAFRRLVCATPGAYRRDRRA